MLRKWNRFLAILLAFALVTTTFNSDFASVRVYADGEEVEESHSHFIFATAKVLLFCETAKF